MVAPPYLVAYPPGLKKYKPATRVTNANIIIMNFFLSL